MQFEQAHRLTIGMQHYLVDGGLDEEDAAALWAVLPRLIRMDLEFGNDYRYKVRGPSFEDFSIGAIAAEEIDTSALEPGETEDDAIDEEGNGDDCGCGNLDSENV